MDYKLSKKCYVQFKFHEDINIYKNLKIEKNNDTNVSKNILSYETK